MLSVVFIILTIEFSVVSFELSHEDKCLETELNVKPFV